MVKEIIFHFGSYKSSMLALALGEKNTQLAAQTGIFIHSPAQFATTVVQFLLKNPSLTAKDVAETPNYHEYKRNLHDLVSQNETLILLFPAALEYPHLFIRLVHDLTNELLPHTKQTAFISLSSQATALEFAFFIHALHGNNLLQKAKRNFFRKKIGNYGTALKNIFAVFGKDRTVCTIDDNVCPSFIHSDNIQTCVNTCMPTAAHTAPFTLQTPFLLDLPVEFYRFCSACNALRSGWYPFFRSPWINQTPYFNDWKITNSPILTSSERTRIIEFYAAENAFAAGILGKERLFSFTENDVKHKPDNQNYVDTLTPETAYEVAKRLDCDFASERLAEFDTIPDHCVNYEQRIVRQALRDTLSCSPSIHPIRKSAPEAKLSVLTLAYNHGEFIEDTIRSVIDQQTDFPIQHIIADDASTDDTQKIILDYASRYPHITPIFQLKNSHGIKNIASLFDMARTPYVALCDGDDYFTDPLKLQKQVDFLEANPTCALCFHPVQVLYEDDTDRARIYPPLEALPRGIKPFYYLTDLLRVNLIQTNSVMYRWRFTKGLPHWFRLDLLPADWYWHLLHAELGKIGFIPEIMSVYRRHKSSIYYSAEISSQLHRHKTGLAELRTYEVINDHFEGKYFSELAKLTNGVFTDALLYANQIDDLSVFDRMVDQYPSFANHFLQSLKRVSARQRE